MIHRSNLLILYHLFKNNLKLFKVSEVLDKQSII